MSSEGSKSTRGPSRLYVKGIVQSYTRYVAPWACEGPRLYYCCHLSSLGCVSGFATMKTSTAAMPDYYDRSIGLATSYAPPASIYCTTVLRYTRLIH
jgi:hypothetical protein